MIHRCQVSSPLGVFEMSASERGLHFIHLLKENKVTYSDDGGNKCLEETIQQLKEYFGSERRTFDINLDWSGHSLFNISVWKILENIPYGLTMSYADVAEQIGNPGAVRAIGLACHKNPWPILIPCHRVVGKNRRLTGYAYGNHVKQWLLEFEWAHRERPVGLLF